MFYQPSQIAGDRRNEPVTSDPLKDAITRVMPDVAAKGTVKDQLGLAAGIIGVCALGALTFAALSTPKLPSSAARPPLVPAAVAPSPQQPTIIDARIMPLTEASESLPPPPQPIEQPLPPQALVWVAPPAPSPVLQGARPQISSGSAVIYDITAGAASPDGERPSGDQARAGTLSDFTGATDRTNQTRAARATNLSSLVIQGTLIPAVLETALNSDLPGYARAFVAVDLTSFDGSKILIPRGTHLIGSYKSGLANGQNRLFVTWTRLIRPDGVSILLADPATDNLGRAGLSGDVDSHFFKRFGASMLLSIVGGYANSLNSGTANTVVIGSAQGAQSATSNALQADSNISPTVKIPQGAQIQVFVGKDLLF